MDENYLEEEEVDLDEARSLTARYVQRSPTVPIKVNEMMIERTEHQFNFVSGTLSHHEETNHFQSFLWLAYIH